MLGCLGSLRTLGEGPHIVNHVPEVTRSHERDLQNDSEQPTSHERNGDKLERFERDHLRDSLYRSLHLRSSRTVSPARPWRHDPDHSPVRWQNGCRGRVALSGKARMVLIGGHLAGIDRSPDRLIFLCGKRSLGETTAVDDHLDQAARSLHQDFPEDRGEPADRQSKDGEGDEIGAGHVSLRYSALHNRNAALPLIWHCHCPYSSGILHLVYKISANLLCKRRKPVVELIRRTRFCIAQKWRGLQTDEATGSMHTD